MKLKFSALIIAILTVLTVFAGCSRLPQQEQGGAQSESQSESQTEAEEVEVTEYFEAAEFLAEKIVMSMPKENFESGEINKAVRNNLIIWLVPNAEEIDMRSPYNSIAYVDRDGYCRFSAKKCAKAMYELFGEENFAPELNDARFDGERGEYIIDWGFGVSAPILASEIWAEASGAGGIAVNFVASKIENVAGDPVWVPFGEYQMQFEVITENGKTFLRFEGLGGEEYQEIPRADTSYPENQYDMSVEAFMEGENDEYFDYLYKIATSTHFAKSAYVYYMGFESYRELSPSQLKNAFYTALQESNNYSAYESENGFTYPQEDIKAILGKYFGGIEPDLAAMFKGYNGERVIAEAGLIGIYSYPTYGYRIVERKDNGDGTVTFVTVRNGEKMVYDEFMPDEKDGAKETFVLRPGENYCYIESFKVEWPDRVLTEEEQKTLSEEAASFALWFQGEFANNGVFNNDTVTIYTVLAAYEKGRYETDENGDFYNKAELKVFAHERFGISDFTFSKNVFADKKEVNNGYYLEIATEPPFEEVKITGEKFNEDFTEVTYTVELYTMKDPEAEPQQKLIGTYEYKFEIIEDAGAEYALRFINSQIKK